MKRLFLAIPINAEITSLCEEFIKLNTQLKTRWIKSENWHITTIFIGDFPENIVADLKKHLSEFYINISPISIVFNQFCYAPSIKNPRMVWGKFYGTKDFDQLIFKTYNSLKHFYKSHQIPFNIEIRQKNIPHITLSRLKKSNSILSKLNEPEFNNTELIINKFQLFESKLLPSGAEYVCLKEFVIN